MENVKKPPEAGMLCTINGDTFFCSLRTCGSETRVSHVTSWITIQVFLTSLTSTSRSKEASYEKGKLHVIIWQVDGTKWVHTLWPVKCCPKAGANLFFLTCKLLQGKISSHHQNNIMVNSSKGNIILDHGIKTHDGGAARVDFLWETDEERAQSATALPKH